MANQEVGELSRTVLHDWHVQHGGRMVPFGGWDMPVQYKSGIIQEHLATRRSAGLFDVSHMGRFRITGKDAERFVLHVLTNNARALEAGQAQYTFIATPTGGAVDDAYLYKIAWDEFLLVVNAANRNQDWQWLMEHNTHPDVHMDDVTEAIAMISLQGPASADILEQLVEPMALPENKRNRLDTVRIDGHELVVARTGYTGEAVCFELFPPAEFAVELWDSLAGRGAAPVGLGARDSLRLEAGLPLYGHELGADREGNEIPLFANSIARLAVRPPGTGPYIGQEAIERQREEFLLLKRGELGIPPDKRILRRLVQPVAVFGSRKPLRAGFEVHREGRAIGYVTSGTTVPYPRFYREDITAVPSEEHHVRPIGLAFLDSTVGYRPDRPVVVQVQADRGAAFEAEVVERNLLITAPYSRPYGGFKAAAPQRRIDRDEVPARAASLRERTDANTRWRRRECINLIPSEQTPSRYVEHLCIADPAGRYNEHKHLPALGPESGDLRFYKGTQFIMDVEEDLKAALRSFFDCSAVEPRVISGQMANDTVFDAIKQFKNRYRRGEQPDLVGPVIVHDLNKGGHLSAQVSGSLKNYIAIDPATGRPKVAFFPFRKSNPYQIDVEQTRAMIREIRPELLVFGRSVIIHKEPVREIAQFIFDEFGRDNPERPLIMYDGAHVLGLLGAHFQDPLKEGADVVTGSTHKTFFGPQRGVILSNIAPGTVFEDLWRFIEARTFPGRVSNHHLGTLLGLLGATYEMLHYRDQYQAAVIRNAKSFATALRAQGLQVEGDRNLDYTETHQILLRAGRGRGQAIADVFEQNNIITNPQAFYDDIGFAAASGVRMGSQEMTRYGMGPDDFTELAGLLADIVRHGDDRPAGAWRDAIRAFRERFVEMRYCLG
jgi:aminomethyltransferase